ncbi:hypothetical protein Tco_1281590 [Tanacetum coccineum]
MLMVDDNVGNQFRDNTMHNVGHLVRQNAVQNQGTHNVGNQNGLSVVPGIANQYGNGNVIAARAKGNSNEINGNQITCYNRRGEGHYASNYTFMAVADACEETERANANCTLENKLQQASISGTQSDKAPVYDSDESAEEMDINKKTENQAKMTKLSMEWKRLCKIKAKVQKYQSQSQY